ncbi:MAG: MFS transporter [Promethearchaeota archaeon]|nr:MAG: MFS transporter [Candidatus Lokiarchaeota archaeon]
MPNVVLAGLFSLLYVDFYWNKLSLNHWVFVGAQILYAVVNSLNDFYFGTISDKTNFQKWGSRRLIYIKWGGILWGLFFFLAWIPWGNNDIVLFVQYLLIICCFDTMLSLVWLVWLALMAELTDNLEERNVMSLNNTYYSIPGYVLIGVGFLLFQNLDSLLIFQIFAGVCAILSAVAYFYIGKSLKERPELYVKQEKIPLLKSLKEVLKSRSYVTMTIFRVFNQLSGALSTSFAFAYLFWLGDGYFYIAFAGAGFGVIGAMINKKLSEKIEMKKLVIWGRSLQILINIATFFILLVPDFKFVIWINIVVTGILGGYSLFDTPIMSLVVDEDEVINRQRREGLILGTNAFFNKIAESIAPILGTSILLIFGFKQGELTQTPEAYFGIKILFLIVPSIVNFIALLGILFFPLHGKKLEELQENLHSMHVIKEEEYNDIPRSEAKFRID